MENKKTVCSILAGLALILAMLSLLLAAKMRMDFSRQRSAADESLSVRLLAAEAEVERLQEKQTQLEKMLEDTRRYACRDIHVKSIAHRGLSAQAPENTLPAFRLAKERGFSCVETDIRFTADGIPVCIHDSDIDRTSNGTGAVSGMTLEELRQYDFGAWIGKEFSGTIIPTFDEFISLCKNIGLHPYIELKTGSSEQIRQLVETVNRYGMRGKVTWISFQLKLLTEVRWCDDEARMGLLISDFDTRMIDELRMLRSGKNEVFLNSCVYSDWVVRECRNAGISLEVWTIDEMDQLAELDPYITGVTSNVLSFGRYLYETEMIGSALR